MSASPSPGSRTRTATTPAGSPPRRPRSTPRPPGPATVPATLLGSTLRGVITLETSGSVDRSAPEPSQSWTRIVDALDTLLSSWPKR
ncbi:hypothetical protein BA895_13780 [Humibacillus sp. DSM 29435]|nr:hypothetical protein BA895_13780 [Humibacillus sp. DSM 29435]